MPQPLRIALVVFTLLGIAGLLVFAFYRAFRKSDEPLRLAVKWVITFLVVGLLTWNTHHQIRSGATSSLVAGAITAAIIVFPWLAAAILFSFMWTGSIGKFLLGPLLSALDGGDEELDPAPLYSIAESLRKKSKYREAIYAIQEQLQKFPADFTGQMMLAEIHAENMNDVQAAETTVRRLCAQPKHTAANLAFAFNSLADWHLKFGQDAEAAQRALQQIVELLPETEFARAASNRIAHLASTETLVNWREPAHIVMKRGPEYLGLLKDQSHLMRKEKGADEQARELVAHLDQHPLDHEARERLAVIYVQEYGRLDFATEQLEQLIATPGESPKHVARWLNLLADLQVQATNQTELAEQTLQRIIELFPTHSAAQKAEERISVLALELKRFEKGRTVKFGTGETTG